MNDNEIMKCFRSECVNSLDNFAVSSLQRASSNWIFFAGFFQKKLCRKLSAVQPTPEYQPSLGFADAKTFILVLVEELQKLKEQEESPVLAPSSLRYLLFLKNEK